MEKKCKVELLPTNDKTRIHKDKEGKLSYSLGAYSKDNFNFHSYQYLYILSDDEIKEGDYRLDIFINNPKPIKADKNYKDSFTKKIIATTNPDLIKEGVASIDDDFIKEYCNNPIEEVLVEYANYYIYRERVLINNNGVYEKEDNWKPKLSKGSVIIKPIEETWDIALEEYNIYLKLYQVTNSTETKDRFIEFVMKNYDLIPKKK
jgi:hypothetical protein